jgi:hypothetical protein
MCHERRIYKGEGLESLTLREKGGVGKYKDDSRNRKMLWSPEENKKYSIHKMCKSIGWSICLSQTAQIQILAEWPWWGGESHLISLSPSTKRRHKFYLQGC